MQQRQNSGMLADSVLVSLAIEAFQVTSRYDSIIYSFLKERLKTGELSLLPKELTLRFFKIQDF